MADALHQGEQQDDHERTTGRYKPKSIAPHPQQPCGGGHAHRRYQEEDREGWEVRYPHLPQSQHRLAVIAGEHHDHENGRAGDGNDGNFQWRRHGQFVR